MSQMTAIQIPSPTLPFEVVKREVPAPGGQPSPHQSASLRHLS